jgi:hypothetical protein
MILKHILSQIVSVSLLIVMFVVVLAFAEHASAEWYAAGYGGVSIDGKLRDVTMPQEGLRLASSQFSFQPQLGDQLTQSYKTSDISLDDSAVFGGKVGYFLDDPSFKWLGFEMDAFTLKPDIKKGTLETRQDMTYIPGDTSQCPLIPSSCPQGISDQRGQLTLAETSLRVIALTMNVVVRYPGTVFQPYLGVGGGAFYFNGSGQFDGQQWVPGLNTQAGLKVLATEEWGFFVEGKYNYATIDNLDPSGYGLSGTYSAFSGVAGVAYHY